MTEILVSRTADRASFKYWDRAGGLKVSEFSGTHSDEPGIIVSATLSHNLLQDIANNVQALMLETFDLADQGRDRTPT